MQKLTKLSIIFLIIISSAFFAACGKEDEGPAGPVLVTSVVLNTEQVNLLISDTYAFSTVVLPENAANKNIIYSSQNQNIATINSSTGVLTAIAAGTVMITVTSTDGSNRFDYANVTVQSEPIGLSAPQNFVLEENTLSWSAVNGALGYIVLINNVPQTATPNTQFLITNYNVMNTYTVKAMGNNHTILDSPPAVAITAKILATPANLSNTQDTISWGQVAGAESYELLVNGAIVNAELNTSIQLDLSAAQTNEIKVRALINGLNSFSSQYSESIQIIRLAVPGEATYQPGGIVWQAVPDAINYVVSVNAAEVTTKLTNYKLPADAEATSYTFKVKATGNGTSILDSVYSVEFVTTKLATPQNLRVQEGKLVWDEVNLAQTYSLKLNGQVVQVGQVLEFKLLDNYLAGIYTINVMANGNGDTFTNSNYSSMISATKLAQSSQVVVVDGVITWLAVPNATRYALKIDEQEFEASNSYFNAGQEVLHGEHFVSIVAEAEGYLYSKATASKLVNKLSVPTNFMVQDGVLSWSNVSNAASYEIVAGSNVFNSGNLNYFTLPLTGDNSYNIKLRAKGDNKKYLNSEYTNIITASKLAAPQNLTLNNGYLELVPVLNAASYILEVNGVKTVMFEEDFPYYLNATGTEYYNIRLLARGNNEYLNSDFTSVLVGYQLPQVQDVVIQNSVITWSHIDGVSEYEVWIKLEETEEYDKLTDVNYSFTNFYDLTSLNSGKYNIKIRALGNDLVNLASVDSIELSFEKLATPINFELKNGMLSWRNVSNATKYLVEINESVQEFSTNNFYILDESYEVGTYNIKVAAYGDGANYITSEWTTQVTADRMEAPQNVRVVNGAVEWDSVIGATNYVVYVAGKYYIGTASEGISSYVVWNAASTYEIELGQVVLPRFETSSPYAAGLHNFVVYAVNDTHFASKSTQPFVINKLNYSINLRVEDGIIKWDSVLNGSHGYRLVINDYIIDTMELSYNFRTHENYVPGNFSIKVLTFGDMGDGVGNRVNSDYASQISIVVMESPNNLRVFEGLINWVPVDGATDYELLVYAKLGIDNYELLELDNPLLTSIGSNYLLGENYPDGDYGVRIRAIGNGSMYITSEYSSLVDVIKLPAPTSLGLINGLITYASVASSTGYQVLANDVFANAGNNTIYELGAEFTEGIYDLYVRAIGDNTVYLTSNLSSGITATKLESIENFRVENGVLKWTPIAGANQYILNVNYQDYLIGLVTSYELPNAFTEGNHQIKIKARGTSGDLLNSSYTTALDVYKTNTVTNLKVEAGIIKWDAAIAPNGYTVSVINSLLVETKIILPSNATGYILPPQFVSGNYTVYVQTNGNSTTNLNSIKAMIEVEKLAIPQTIELQENNDVYSLVWSSVIGTTSYRLAITRDGLGVYNEIIEGLSYEVQAELEQGIYLVSVQAIGNTTNELTNNKVNSDFKAPITVTKPSTPTNFKIENGMASWDASMYATEYKLKISYNNILLEEEVVTVNTYYYLTGLGDYEISVRASYFGSLPSEKTAEIQYTFDLFSDGNGSGADPFQISTATELRNVKYNPTAHYILIDNIFLTTANFEPIGNVLRPFTGEFNGNLNEISNLTVSSTYTYAGMFGYVDTSAVIKNLSLSGVNITSASEYSGTIAGYSKGNITRVQVVGNVRPNLNDAGKVLYAGGLVGENVGTIELSTAQVQVEPVNLSNLVYAGGIAGYNHGLIYQSGTKATSSVRANFAGGVAGYNNGRIEQSYNKGSVLGESKLGASPEHDYAHGYAGGIAGYNLNTDALYTGLVINSYNWGTVTATSNNVSFAYAGGVVGYNRYVSASSYGEVKWSYNSGLVTATNSYVINSRYAGGVVGYNQHATKLTESYYLNTSASTVTHGTNGTSCTSKSDADLKSSNFATSLNNSNGPSATIWKVITLNVYAQLAWEENY